MAEWGWKNMQRSCGKPEMHAQTEGKGEMETYRDSWERSVQWEEDDAKDIRLVGSGKWHSGCTTTRHSETREVLLSDGNLDAKTVELSVLQVYWCRFRCRAKWSDLANARSQWGHLKGLTPVCFLMCLVSSSDRANFQLQPSQLHL